MTHRTVAVEFTALKSLEDFDWRFNPSISRKDIYELAAGHFIRKATDILFVGPPGIGKSGIDVGRVWHETVARLEAFSDPTESERLCTDVLIRWG